MRADQPTRTAHRRGGVALETLLLLPVVLLVGLAFIEFSLLLSARERLTAASREGARVASQGGDEAAVEQAVRVHLGNGNFQNARIDSHLHDHQGQPLRSGDPVGVWVTLPANAASPDLLSLVGFSLQEESLAAGTVLRKE